MSLCKHGFQKSHTFGFACPECLPANLGGTPWTVTFKRNRIDGNAICGFTVRDNGGHSVCALSSNSPKSPKQIETIGRLVTEAPNLVAELKKLMVMVELEGGGYGLQSMAMVIARAEGKSEQDVYAELATAVEEIQNGTQSKRQSSRT